MMDYSQTLRTLRAEPRCWLVTGAAGFIGSHLIEHLLRLKQRVVGLDNFATGFQANLDLVQSAVGADWKNFSFIEGDIEVAEVCELACQGVDLVLHQAALGSVPRSIENPAATNRTNVDGFLHMLSAAKDAGVQRFVYASSSSVYGDHPDLPKQEDNIGNQLSPYAVSKYSNELYAKAFASCYQFPSIGLRYFNVFGARQNPTGPYAAVVPLWIDQILNGEACVINGDGETSRDFSYIDNVVQANIMAATQENPQAVNTVYNVAYGATTSLNDLFASLKSEALRLKLVESVPESKYQDFRVGDIRHSFADISRARELLNFFPTHSVQEGLAHTLAWYAARSSKPLASPTAANI